MGSHSFGAAAQSTLNPEIIAKTTASQTVCVRFGSSEQLREGTTAGPYHKDGPIHILLQPVSKGQLDLGNLI